MPYCPKCRAEYVDGIGRCSDCDIELVAVLPPEPGDPDIELVEVVRVNGEVKAQLVHGLLESEGIESYMKGEAIRYVHGFSLGRLGLVRMMVRAEDEQRARDVLNSAQDDWEDSDEEGPME